MMPPKLRTCKGGKGIIRGPICRWEYKTFLETLHRRDGYLPIAKADDTTPHAWLRRGNAIRTHLGPTASPRYSETQVFRCARSGSRRAHSYRPVCARPQRRIEGGQARVCVRHRTTASLRMCQKGRNRQSASVISISARIDQQECCNNSTQPKCSPMVSSAMQRRCRRANSMQKRSACRRGQAAQIQTRAEAHPKTNSKTIAETCEEACSACNADAVGSLPAVD